MNSIAQQDLCKETVVAIWRRREQCARVKRLSVTTFSGVRMNDDFKRGLGKQLGELEIKWARYIDSGHIGQNWHS
jgi:hypothetical protein